MAAYLEEVLLLRSEDTELDDDLLGGDGDDLDLGDDDLDDDELSDDDE